jgi:hypothetical protein
MRKVTKRSTAVVLAGVAVLGIAGAAWAAWTLTGSGSAQARAGSVVGLRVTSAGLPAGGLTPGNATTVLLTVENRNQFPVRITAIELSDVKSGKRGCVAGENVDVVNGTPLPPPAEVTVPAGSDADPAASVIRWNGPLRMHADPADACQGAPFSFTVPLDAVSAAS